MYKLYRSVYNTNIKADMLNKNYKKVVVNMRKLNLKSIVMVGVVSASLLTTVGCSTAQDAANDAREALNNERIESSQGEHKIQNLNDAEQLLLNGMDEYLVMYEDGTIDNDEKARLEEILADFTEMRIALADSTVDETTPHFILATAFDAAETTIMASIKGNFEEQSKYSEKYYQAIESYYTK